MPRFSVWLSALVCVCACVNLSTGEDFQTNSQAQGDYLLPEGVKRSGTEQDEYGEKSQGEDEVSGNKDTRSSITSLWARILNRLGKTSDTFVTSGRYPSRVSRIYQGHRLNAPLWSNLKNDNGLQEERALNADKFKSAKQKKAGNLSINGALSSLADMLAAEGHRRNQAAAHHLRQRLLVAGRRR